MEGNILNLINKIYLNNNILLEINNDLQQIKDESKENKTIQRLSEIIIKMNNMINENKNNTDIIRNDISKLYEQMNKQFNELKINNNILNNQEIKYNFDNRNNTNKRVKYIGQVLNGVPEGKGIMYWNNGDRYEGDWKNDERKGKEIFIGIMVIDMKVIGKMIIKMIIKME